MGRTEPTHSCPVCRKRMVGPVRAAEPGDHFPFCSERCKMADLGLWMSGTYRISRSLRPSDIDSFDPEGNGLYPQADPPE